MTLRNPFSPISLYRKDLVLKTETGIYNNSAPIANDIYNNDLNYCKYKNDYFMK